MKHIQMTILQGSVGKYYIHLLISCPPSKLLQYLKSRSSRLLQDEFSELEKRYWSIFMCKRIFLQH
ncbi:transposase [Paraliobacillus sp. JSM ZJ581]|uniref:transposase n=1 Tax=Paraliobacillus sp. JSM ZJ581 TaxID=3342118 RepID=UPI0035A9802F